MHWSVGALQCAGIDAWRSCKDGGVAVRGSSGVGVFRRVVVVEVRDARFRRHGDITGVFLQQI